MYDDTTTPEPGDWMRGMSFSGAPIVGTVLRASGGTHPIEDPTCVEIDGRSSSGRPRVRWCELTMIERVKPRDDERT